MNVIIYESLQDMQSHVLRYEVFPVFQIGIFKGGFIAIAIDLDTFFTCNLHNNVVDSSNRS